MKETKHIVQAAETIREYLQQRPFTRRELADLTKIEYYTVRNAILHLQNLGQVKQIGRSTRNAKFTLVNSDGPNRIIPEIQTTQGLFKLHTIANLYSNPSPAAAVAVLNLPRDVARLFKIAYNLRNGLPTTDVSLPAVRHEMEQSLKSLQNAVNVYQQILDSSRVWNPELLAKFPNDVDYDHEVIERALKHYFKEEED